MLTYLRAIRSRAAGAGRWCLASSRQIASRTRGSFAHGKRRALAFIRSHEWRPWKKFELSDEEKPRSLLIPAVLGALLVGVSFFFYFTSISPPRPPAVDGAGEIYVSAPDVLTRLAVTFSPSRVRPGRSHVQLDVVFYGLRSKPIDWALVLYGDAQLSNPDDPSVTAIPPGARITSTEAGYPPFAANRKEQVQVIWGTAYPANLSGQVSAVLISGWLHVAVFSQGGPAFTLSLPRYGRVHLSPLFQFPQMPGAIDIGVPGTWKRPDNFEVDVDAGTNDANQRIDVASPDVIDPTTLHWESSESVRAVLRRTDLQKEAIQQTEIFLLGAIVGAGASSVVATLERVLTRLKVRPRGA